MASESRAWMHPVPSPKARPSSPCLSGKDERGVQGGAMFLEQLP